ncbi:uncharacterized protein [Rutidosis leptorrhynchoides]|uniref:uncharacterized protein n=1 Tax=Rutidosis leptorrhynchoides TaxID=125765 RepID=UPI003A9949C9
MYEGAKSCVRTPVGNTEVFPIEVAMHQGSALSPFLFALILDELSRGIQECIPWCLIFADDIVLVSESKEELNRRLEQWRGALEGNGLQISRQKTEYLRCDFDRNNDEQDDGVNICIGDQILHPQTSFRDVGKVLSFLNLSGALHSCIRMKEWWIWRPSVYFCLFSGVHAFLGLVLGGAAAHVTAETMKKIKVLENRCMEQASEITNLNNLLSDDVSSPSCFLIGLALGLELRKTHESPKNPKSPL